MAVAMRNRDANQSHTLRSITDGNAPGEDSAVSRGMVAHILMLVLLCGVLYVPRAWSLALADPEEARCALIVRHMLSTGDFIVPHLGGQAYYDKPAPYFWLAALGRKLTGSAELGGRLVSGVSALLAALIAYAFGRRLFGPRAGLLAGIVLATSGEFFFFARWYRMDMPFAAAMWAALWCFWRSEMAVAEQPSKRHGLMGFYAFCGVATLLKGPAGLVLPALVVAAYLLLGKQPERLFELLRPSGIILYLLIAAPWYVAISLSEPGYAYEFFVRQNLSRFGGVTGRHGMPGIVYVPILLAGLMPWTIYLPGIAIRCFPRHWRQRNDRPELLFLWLSALVPLVFFMLAKTTLANYILPVFPPLAVMMGGLLANWIVSHKPDRLMRLGQKALLAAVLLFPLVPVAAEAWLRMIDPWIALPIGASILAVLMMRQSLRHAQRASFVGWGVAAVVATYAFLIGHTAPSAYELASTRSLAKLISPADVSLATLCYWNGRAESFAFYTGCSKIAKFGRSRPEDIETLAGLLESSRRTYCLVRGRDALDELENACRAQPIIMQRNGCRWLVTNCEQCPLVDGNMPESTGTPTSTPSTYGK